MNCFIWNTFSTSSFPLLLLITFSKSQTLQRHQQPQKYKFGYDRDRGRQGNVQDFSVIEDSFYRPRKGDIIIEDFTKQLDFEGAEEGKYYQKSPKYSSQVSVASSHGRPKGPEYPFKTRPIQPQPDTTTFRPTITTFQYSSEDRQEEEGGQRSPSYFQTKKKFYDPFSFQSTKKSTPVSQYLENNQKKKDVFLNRLDSRFSIPESNYVSLNSAQKKQRPTTRRPVVISYDEATKSRRKSTLAYQAKTQTPYRRRPHHAESSHMTEASTGQQSRYQTNPGRQTTKKSGSAGYRGGINPVFVSLNERENVAIRSRIPTPPPRNYFPVRKSEIEEYNNDDYNEVTEKIFSNDNYVYNGFYKDRIDEISTESNPSYSPPYKVTRPSSDQWNFWETQEQQQLTTTTTRRPPAYFDNSNIWPEYNKVVNDLLEDGESRYQVDSNKYVGQPQFVSTRPLIVSPGMEETGDSQLQAGNIVNSYSDRYGWGGERDYNRDRHQQYNRNWTSIELAKPDWEEDMSRRDLGDSNVGSGYVQEVDMTEVDTYGSWDQSLDIMPAMSRSTDPRPKQWVLLSKTNEMVELVDSLTGGGQADSTNTATLSVTVDASKYS